VRVGRWCRSPDARLRHAAGAPTLRPALDPGQPLGVLYDTLNGAKSHMCDLAPSIIPDSVGGYMRFRKWPLGHQVIGAVVEVALRGVASDVFIVDDANLSRLERGDQYTYYGGHYTQSPVRLRVPSSGMWTAVVIPIGGSVQASVRVFPAAA
jgi:hypothetical protein